MSRDKRMTELSEVLISVVIPAYNAERYLGPAIESILAQPYRPLEIVVVDDGSEDRTAAVALSFGPEVRLLSAAHAGAGAARNRGVAEARGAFLAFLDADDLWTPCKLACQLARFATSPLLDYVLGQATEFHDGLDGVQDGRTLPGASAGAMLIRTEAFHRVGPFRTDLRLGEFIDWLARAREMGLCGTFVTEVVLRRRIHKSNIGIRERSGRTDYAKVAHAVLARRRQRT